MFGLLHACACAVGCTILDLVEVSLRHSTENRCTLLNDESQTKLVAHVLHIAGALAVLAALSSCWLAARNIMFLQSPLHCRAKKLDA